MMRFLGLALTFAFLCTPLAAPADDFGPSNDVRDARWAAMHLLEYRYGVVTLSDAVVVKDQALMAWRSGKASGKIGLVRYQNRWWDVFDGCNHTFPLPGYVFSNELYARAGRLASGTCSSAERHDDDGMVPLTVSAGEMRNDPAPSGDQGTFSYSGADVSGGMLRFRMRAPSPAELEPMPTPPRTMGGPTEIAFFYIDVKTPKPATLGNMKLDVWVPWVLPDSLRYELEMFQGMRLVGPVRGTLSKNVLHFDIPPFVFADGEVQGQIDGYW